MLWSIVTIIAGVSSLIGSGALLQEAEKRQQQAILHEKISCALLERAERLRRDAIADLMRSRRLLEKMIELAIEMDMPEESLRGFIAELDSSFPKAA